MKQPIVYTLMSMLILSANTHAATDVCQNNHGILHCTAGEVSSIHHLGRADLSGTHVIGETNILGDVEANNVEFSTATITGNVTANHMRVHQSYEATGNTRTNNSEFQSQVHLIGDVHGSNDVFQGATKMIGSVKLSHDLFKQSAEFTGKLLAEEAMFDVPIRINGCVTEFYHSKSSHIELSAQRECSREIQKLYLYDKSQVRGNVVFQGGNGKIFLSKDSTILGQVIGGVIVRE